MINGINAAAAGKLPPLKPICAHCGSDQIVRDACARWIADTRQWKLAGVQDCDFCDACNAEGIDIVHWVAAEPDIELPVIIGARVRIRDRQMIGGNRFNGREGVVVRENSVDGLYVRLDVTPGKRVQKVMLVMPHHLDVLWLPGPSTPSVHTTSEDI